MRVHLVNPSDLSFGTAVSTPRWLFVLAAATPARFGTLVIVDETLEPFHPDTVQPGDVVGIGVHTANVPRNGVPLTRYWLIPPAQRPKVYSPHPLMAPDEIRQRTQAVWDRFYRLAAIWQRSVCVRSIRSRIAFVLISKLYRQMYANTGIATDSARVSRSVRRARWLARIVRRLFIGAPMLELQEPTASPAFARQPIPIRVTS